MPGKDFDTRAALMKSGKAEFLARGYKGASLRTICKNARVTTGAFYVHFAKKEDLFNAIVEEGLPRYYEMYNNMMRALIDGAGDVEDDGIKFGEGLTEGDYTESSIMDYLMENRDLFKLLFDCSKGTGYEGFKDELILYFENSYQRFFDAHATRPIDHNVVRIVVQMKFTQYMHLLFGGFSDEEVRKLTEELACFTEAGFLSLMKGKSEHPAT